MAAPTFEWDAETVAENVRKHGGAFEEALRVFQDALARIHDDPDHSDEESRAIITGHSTQNRLLLVSFTERRSRIRIISARPGTRAERQDYEENA